jgi:hypothetical protein
LPQGIVELTLPFSRRLLRLVARRPTTLPGTNAYKRHGFPVEILSHCGWWYFRFCLSSRDVEELMVERDGSSTYAAVR